MEPNDDYVSKLDLEKCSKEVFKKYFLTINNK